MSRFIFGPLLLIVLTFVIISLWIVNPTLAFIGGIFIIVFVMVGFALIMNRPPVVETAEEKEAIAPRRTGEFRSIQFVEKPEATWDTADNKPEPKKTTPPLPPAPVPQVVARHERMPDFDKMSIEELTEWTKPPEPPTKSTTAQGKMDTATFFAVDVNEDEADDLFDMDKVGNMVEAEMEFDNVASNMKRKMESGTFGESAEEVEEFFKVAFEKASARNEIPDYIDSEEEEDDLEPESGFDEDEWLTSEWEDVDVEFPDWLDSESPEPADENGMDWLIDTDAPTKPPEAPASATPPAPKLEPEPALNFGDLMTDESNNFDLMGMVGELAPDKQQEFFALMTEIPIGDQTETQLIRLYERLFDAGELEPELSEAQFTAYYPRQASVGTDYGLYVYAHLPQALINADIQAFQAELGGRVPKPVVADETVQIQEGTSLAVIVYCDDLDFDRRGSVQQWKSPFVRFDFNFNAQEPKVDETVSGRIAIMLGIIEVASIDFQILITPASKLAMVTAIPHNPLNAENYQSSATMSPYQKIFISYAREDTVVAEQYRKAQMMAGNITFMDTHSIRAGQDWEQALKQFIDEADVFQLFWSEHSASSDHVKFEWDYALNHRCPDTRCVQFIRPAYWQKPLPAVPSQLGHLHFAYVELD